MLLASTPVGSSSIAGPVIAGFVRTTDLQTLRVNSASFNVEAVAPAGLSLSRSMSAAKIRKPVAVLPGIPIIGPVGLHSGHLEVLP